MILKDHISRHQATITYSCMPKVYANKSLISQILQNLISNSLKYRNEHTPAICISAVDKGTFFLISVEDNGMGIPAKYLKKIFSEYTRLNPDSQKGSV